MAIGIGYGPMGQVLPDEKTWYDINLPLIDATLRNKQNTYDQNMSMLSDLSSKRSAITPLPGLDTQVAEKIKDYMSSEEERISKLYSGDLSKASAELDRYRKSISDLFSSEGYAGKINRSYQTYSKGLEEAKKRQQEGKLKDWGAWYSIQKPLESYKETGIFGDPYSTLAVSDYVDEDKLVKDYLDDWKPDVTQEGITKSSDGKFYTIKFGKKEEVPYYELKRLAKDYLTQNQDVANQRRMMWDYYKTNMPSALGSYREGDDWKNIEQYKKPLLEEKSYYQVDKNSNPADILRTQAYINDKYGINIAEDGKWGPETQRYVELLSEQTNKGIEDLSSVETSGIDSERYNFLRWLDDEYNRVADRWASKEGYVKDLSTYKTGVDPNYESMLRLRELKKKHSYDLQLAEKTAELQRELVDYENFKEDPLYGMGTQVPFVSNNPLGVTEEQINESIGGMKTNATQSLNALYDPLLNAFSAKVKNNPNFTGKLDYYDFTKNLKNEMQQVIKQTGSNMTIEEAFAEGLFDNYKFKSLNNSTITGTLGNDSSLYNDKKNAVMSNVSEYRLALNNINKLKEEIIKDLSPQEAQSLNKPKSVLDFERSVQPLYEKWATQQREKGNFTSISFDDFIQSNVATDNFWSGTMATWARRNINKVTNPLIRELENQMPADVRSYYNKSASIRNKVNEGVIDRLTSSEKGAYLFYAPEKKEQDAIVDLVNRNNLLSGAYAINPDNPKEQISIDEMLKDKEYKVTGFRKSQSGIAGNGYVMEFNVEYKVPDPKDADKKISKSTNFYIPRSQFQSKDLTELESSPAGMVERNVYNTIAKGYRYSAPIEQEDIEQPAVFKKDSAGNWNPVIPKVRIEMARDKKDNNYWWHEYDEAGNIKSTYGFDEGKNRAIGNQTAIQLMDKMNSLGIPRFGVNGKTGDYLTLGDGNTRIPFDLHKYYLDRVKDIIDNPRADVRDVATELLQPLYVNPEMSKKEDRWIANFKSRPEEGDVEAWRLDANTMQQLLNIAKTKYKWNEVYRTDTKSDVVIDPITGQTTVVPKSTTITTKNYQR